MAQIYMLALDTKKVFDVDIDYDIFSLDDKVRVLMIHNTMIDIVVKREADALWWMQQDHIENMIQKASHGAPISVIDKLVDIDEEYGYDLERIHREQCKLLGLDYEKLCSEVNIDGCETDDVEISGYWFD